MAGPDIPKIEHEITQETERTIREYSDRRNPEKAAEFERALGEMQAALGKIAKALDRANFKNDDDHEKANAVFGQKLADALRTFHRMNEFGARDLAVKETRGELNRLGLLMEKGPANYPKPRFVMRFFQPSQVEQWLKDAEANPAAVAADIATAARNAAAEAQSAGAANQTETKGIQLAAAEAKRLDELTHGAFSINTGDE